MSTNLRFFAMLFVAMGVLFFTSCENQEEPAYESGQIVGEWSLELGEIDEIWEVRFNKDSTGKMIVTDTNTGDTATYNFSYDYLMDDRYLQVLETTCPLSGSYDVMVSAKRLELYGYNYYFVDNLAFVFKRI